jgi:hypothetical protein
MLIMAKSLHLSEKSAQKDLVQFAENLRQCPEQTEDDVFNRKERLANLRDGKFTAEKDTIFSAIFQELKRKEEKKAR